MGFFTPRPPIDEEEFAWLLAVFAWLDRTLGHPGDDDLVRLILPSSEFFPPTDARGELLAEELFLLVKAMCGMQEWPCQLLAGEKRQDRSYELGFGGKQDSRSALGTFALEEAGAVICYDPELADDPAKLVAVFAHELSHYLMHDIGDPPGGEELSEHATDCLAAYLGYGIFLANSAKQFQQFTDHDRFGWRMQTAGYLSELALVTLSALFIRRFGEDDRQAEKALKPYLRKPFRKAVKAIDHRFTDLKAGLLSIDLEDWA